MPFSIQAKILRLLQEKCIERLGGREAIPVDVRVIAATNRDLEAALAKAKFREDLYYRLKVVTVGLPPLRDRTEDIPLLTDYFLARFAGDMGIDNPGISKEAKGLLKNHTWQGHVRELSNVIQKALIFSRGGPIGIDDISRVIRSEYVVGERDEKADEAINQWIRSMLVSDKREGKFNRLMDRLAREVIVAALELTNGNRSRASEILGISRPTLLSKIDKYRLQTKTSVKGSSS
jgi:two-component system nitrogen regulation response regulator GlnG